MLISTIQPLCVPFQAPLMRILNDNGESGYTLKTNWQLLWPFNIYCLWLQTVWIATKLLNSYRSIKGRLNISTTGCICEVKDLTHHPYYGTEINNVSLMHCEYRRLTTVLLMSLAFPRADASGTVFLEQNTALATPHSKWLLNWRV